ncbi:MAG: hypothetical protein BRD50_02355 [Bacteroidetes bacterium SW_11_45_7]|nr:MAG: hypothetical protein BRD50_02355 [Bacteroidetes bacterium SW_11_45_7]
MNPNDHTCTNLLRKVELALDGELTHDEEKQLFNDLEQNPWCFDVYDIEKCFKQFLTEKIERKRIDESTIKCIRERIQTEGEAIEGNR